MENPRIYEYLLELCRIRSISETPGEDEIVKYLEEKTRGFQRNHGRLTTKKVPIPGDRFERHFFYGLYESAESNGKTVILLSHHDVVSIGDYGKYQDLAFLPEEYTQLLKEGKGPLLNEECEEDLRSGDWLFGRGTMDMKFGLAMSIETLRAAVEEGGFSENLLLLSVPDEEANSAGMLGSVEVLKALKEEKRLKYCGALIPEPFFNKLERDPNKYIYSGVVGKLLPVVLAVGKEAHSCEPLSGLSAASLISEYVREAELNPALMDAAGDFVTPPPVCLKIGDLREGYSVSILGAAYAYFNIMTINKNPDQVMSILKSIGKSAFDSVLNKKKNQIEQMNREYKGGFTEAKFSTKVWSFSELSAFCRKSMGSEFDEKMEKIALENRQMDARELTIKMMMEAVKLLPEKEPMLLISYGPPFYPHSKKEPGMDLAVVIAEKIMEYGKKELKLELKHEAFFPGLSDMSYLGLENGFSAEALSENFPMWGKGYDLPLQTIRELNIPFICLGPWGKDAHKYTERLNLSYSFSLVPKLFHEAIKMMAL